MKITFIKDCPPVIASGNSAYKKGDEADLRLGSQLVEAGYAREGWGKVKPEPVKETAVSEPKYTLEIDTSNMSEMTYRELQKWAKSLDIPANQAKDDLAAAILEALENGDN